MKTTKINLLLLSLAFLPFNLFTLSAQCSRYLDSLALVELYNATDGPNWNNTWDLNTPLNTWYGVFVNGNGCVYELDLDGNLGCGPCRSTSGNNLTGNIPADFFLLTEIQEIYLSLNQLSGSIPTTISNITTLEKLWIVESDLSGNIPSEIGQLTALKQLALWDNNLSGTLPPELGNLNQLANLYLENNNLSGSLPPELGNLQNLSFIQLFNNNLSGPIPSELGNMSSLKFLRIENNNLSGPIPLEFANIPSLIEFRVFNNQLSGLIPDFSVNNTQMNHFPFHGNEFSFGDILPNHQANSDLIDQNKVNSSDYYSYNPQGPLSIDTIIYREVGTSITLDLKIDEGVTTNVYKWYKNGNLESTITGSNKLTINNIQSSDYGLWECQVTNPNLADLILDIKTITLDPEPLTNCRRNDSLGLVDLYHSTGGDNWDVQWDFSQPIDTWEGVTLDENGCLFKVGLRFNNLTGQLPEFTAFHFLDELDLKFNEINGTIPASITNLTNATRLFLHGNNFTGNLPAFFGEMTNLQYLFLGINEFTGSIPSGYSNLTNLVTLDACYNNLTGDIPASFENMNIRALYLENNSLKGDISSNVIQTLSQLHILDISNNSFYGVLPNFEETAPGIYGLQIKGNAFTFEDILPNFEANKRVTEANTDFPNTFFFEYSPQDKLLDYEYLYFNLGDNFTIDLEVDDTVSSNIYNWYKDDQLIATNNANNQLTLTDLQFADEGDYTCNVTNPNVPDLTLESSPYDIRIYRPTCYITLRALDQTTCDPRYNTFSQNIEVTFIGTGIPTTGFLVVDGKNFPILASPYTISLSSLEADGNRHDIVAYFSDKPTCSVTQYNLINAPDACVEGTCDEIDLNLNDITSKNVHHARDHITSNATVYQGNDIVFRAGESITLTSGFLVEKGADFFVQIMDCTMSTFEEEPPSENRTSKNLLFQDELNIQPNPFQTTATIEYQLAENQLTSLNIYSLTGQLLEELIPIRIQAKGTYTHELNVPNLKSGIYLVVLNTGQNIITRKIILVE